MHRPNFILRTVGLLGIAAACGAAVNAYSVSDYKWGTSTVIFYLNPSNADVSASAAEAAFKTALNVWTSQGGARFSYQYGGQANVTSTMNDGRNVAMFRNSSNGGSVANTYSWWSGGMRVDSDIVFWDGAYKFFAGSSGCTSGVYIEDFATHELGHALGLSHSGQDLATMAPSTGWCSQNWRTLHDDDIAGIKHLYGASSGSSTTTSNTAPSVTIQSPASGSSFAQGTTITLSGSATDSQDGGISGRIKWASSLQGQLGSGATLSIALGAGTHAIRASVTDSGGLTDTADVTITVTSSQVTVEPLPSSSPSTVRTLTARGYRAGNKQKVDLAWTGFSTSTVDIYRNSKRIRSAIANDGAHTDRVTGRGSFVYLVCDAGTTKCSNQASVSF